MAIGARIISNNLSGQTATVTFLPATGGTINLGSQTIPFNNLTTYPYGVYQIYVPLYDYTYELTIEAPTNVKSFTWVSKLITNNNYGTATLNYNDLTAEIIDLDIDSTGWYLQDIYPLTDSGYAYYFQNNNTCDLQWVVFADSTGKIIESHETNCDCDYSYENLGGKWVTFEDYFNGVLKYFNGTDVYTYEVDPSYQYIYAQTGWDGVMSGGSFVVAIENYTAQTINQYIVNGPILTQFGETVDISNGYPQVSTYFDGSFVVTRFYEYSTGFYTNFKIYDGTTGNSLQNIDLTSYNNFNNYEFRFYGNNKCVNIFYNYSDSNIDYLIIQYNGNTDVLNITTHNRSNYPQINGGSQTNFFPNNGGSEAFYFVLYTENGYNDIGTVVTYCDIIYMLSGDTTIQTYNFQDSGSADKTIRNYAAVSNNIFFSCDNGDGYVSVLSFTSTGTTFHNTNLLMSSNPSVNDIVDCGNGYVGSFYEGTYTSMTLIHVSEDGTLGDLINGITLTGNYLRRSDYVGDIYQMLTYDGQCFIITPQSPLFTSGITFNGNQVYTYYPTDKFRPGFIEPGLIATVDYNTKEIVLLSSTGLTSVFSLPTSNNFDVRLGDTMFMYTYLDDVSGLTSINLYDFDFNLISSATTEFTSWYDTGSCGDNFFVTVDENNKLYVHLVKDTTITQNSLTDYNTDYYTFNDYIWWD